jgi:hypothetical protein
MKEEHKLYMVIKVGQRDKKQKSKYKKENVFFTIG